MQATTNGSTVTTVVSGQMWTVPSFSQPNEIHVVKRVVGGLQCDCTASFYGKTCRHIAAVAAVATLERKWESAKRAVGLEEARRIVLAQMMGRTA